MELAAVIVASLNEDFGPMHSAPQNLRSAINAKTLCSSRVPILGNDVLHSWTERIRQLGVRSLWLTTSLQDGNRLCSALAGLARQGIERLLMIKLKSYAEIDLLDFVRFHRERHNSVTEARDARGRLGISLLDHRALRGSAANHELRCSAGNVEAPYSFSGYAKRILSAKERQELVDDGLTGACAMRPAGTEARENVWIAKGAEVASSVRIIGPAYIGVNAVIRAGATVGPFSSIERNCVVDCGTTVERSTVLPHTYLGPGLLIRQSLVDGSRLENLRCGTVADLEPAGLGSRMKSREWNSLEWPLLRSKWDGERSIFRERSILPWSTAQPSTGSEVWHQVQL